MKTIVAVAVLTLTLVRAAAAGDDPALEAALATLRAAETLDDEAVGYAGAKSETYKAYEVLLARADAKLLVRLTDDENAVVRCYALRALAEAHRDVPLLPIVLRHLADTDPVETFEGCCRGEWKVGDVMLRDAWERLSPEEEHEVLQKLLEKDCPLAERDRVLRTRTFAAEWLPRIRALAEDGVDAALLALARYRRPEDVPLILTPLAAESSPFVAKLPALQAAALHGGAALMPALVALAGEARISLRQNFHHVRYWYAAVAAQRSDRAAALLTEALREDDLTAYARSRNAGFLFEETAPRYAAVYRPLLWRLWRDHALIDADVLAHLSAAEPVPVAEQAARDLTERVNRVPASAIDPLFQAVLEELPDRASSVLTGVLLRADVHHFCPAAKIAAEIRGEDQIAPLLTRMTNDVNPHVYLAAAEALLAYGRPAIRKKIESLVASREHLRTGWGGEKLKALLAR